MDNANVPAHHNSIISLVKKKKKKKKTRVCVYVCVLERARWSGRLRYARTRRSRSSPPPSVRALP